MSRIKRARIAAKLTQHEIGAAIGRTGQYVGLVERCEAHVSLDLEHTILIAIARLAAFKESLRRSKEQLVDDLKLPSIGSSIR